MLDTETKQKIGQEIRIALNDKLDKRDYELNNRLLRVEEQIRELTEELKNQGVQLINQGNELKNQGNELKLQRQELKHQRELIQQVVHNMDKRFNHLTWMIGIGFTTLALLIGAFGFFLSLTSG